MDRPNSRFTSVVLLKILQNSEMSHYRSDFLVDFEHFTKRLLILLVVTFFFATSGWRKWRTQIL